MAKIIIVQSSGSKIKNTTIIEGLLTCNSAGMQKLDFEKKTAIGIFFMEKRKK